MKPPSIPANCPQLNHEKLDSYRVAVEFLAITTKVLDRFPRGFSQTADQLRRASLSIPLNIAEGYGKRTTPDRNKLYGIARGSAHECGAIFDSLKILKIVDDSIYIRGKTLLHRVVSMLIKMGA
jgi:four helix bundle protein